MNIGTVNNPFRSFWVSFLAFLGIETVNKSVQNYQVEASHAPVGPLGVDFVGGRKSSVSITTTAALPAVVVETVVARAVPAPVAMVAAVATAPKAMIKPVGSRNIWIMRLPQGRKPGRILIEGKSGKDVVHDILDENDGLLTLRRRGHRNGPRFYREVAPITSVFKSSLASA